MVSYHMSTVGLLVSRLLLLWSFRCRLFQESENGKTQKAKDAGEQFRMHSKGVNVRCAPDLACEQPFRRWRLVQGLDVTPRNGRGKPRNGSTVDIIAIYLSCLRCKGNSLLSCITLRLHPLNLCTPCHSCCVLLYSAAMVLSQLRPAVARATKISPRSSIRMFSSQPCLRKEIRDAYILSAARTPTAKVSTHP
jgi:hypothetical protein